MTFRITADALFEAEDIDDAFLALAAYFLAVARHGTDAPDFLDLGQIEVQPARMVTKRCSHCGHITTHAENPGESWSMGRCAGCLAVVTFEEVAI